jgi:para-aminobenzoate synthetase component 1
MLESSLRAPRLGRYTFIGCRPFQYFSSSRKTALQELKQEFDRYRAGARPPRALPFASGIVGYIGYDHGRKQENILSGRPGPRVPDVGFGFYDALIVLDHLTGSLYLTSSGLPERGGHYREKLARQRLQDMLKRLRAALSSPSPDEKAIFSGRRPGSRLPAMQGEMTRAQYVRRVSRALDYIRRGDIYQVNVAQRFFMSGEKRYSKRDAVCFYQTLRGLSPSCFGAYFDGGAFQIVSSSPERFLQLKGRRVTTRPMKGTRPRGSSPQQDLRFKHALLSSPKEQAELLMITDLLRNDLGRVCAYGTVRVDALRTLEAYATVYQATSTVSGLLKPGLDGFDVLAACSPGGSITGCPKIRAMEIIDELEPSRRSVYTGALGYMDFTGDMDFSILIRALLVQPRAVSFHVGAGIVADSCPAAEYEETLVKARAMRRCLQGGSACRTGFTGPEGLRLMVIDGEFIEADESRRRALTPGVLRAPGVFETLRVSRGRVFFFPEHIRRMKKSLLALGMSCPADPSDFLRNAARLSALQKIREGRLRLAVWREGRRPRWCVAAEPYDPPRFRRGFQATVSACRVPATGPQVGHKMVRYAPYYAESRKAAAKGYDEALFLNRQGHLAEGSRTNIFWVNGGVLWTPALKTGCLPGIVRAKVLALARDSGRVIRRGAYPPDALFEAEEAFLTNSLIGIMPLLKIDGYDIGRGRPGKVTAALMAAYRRLTESSASRLLFKTTPEDQPAGAH